MGDRVQEILSWYESDNAGTKTNLARLLNGGKLGGSGKLVIMPVDQGFEHGPARSFAPNPAGYNPQYHFQLAIDAGCNAYAAPLGFLEAGAGQYAGRIPLILKLNNHDVLHEEKDPLPAVTGSVKDALRLGCSAIGFTIYPGSSHCTHMYEQLRALGEEAKASGLAVVAYDYAAARLHIRNGETGVLAPYAAPGAFVEAAVDLVRSPRLLDEIRRRAPAAVVSADWQGVVDRFEELLRGEEVARVDHPSASPMDGVSGREPVRVV